MGAAMKITRRDNDGRIELEAIGELDLSTVAQFETALKKAVDDAGPDRAVTLDLRGVEYLDSAAINVLFAHAGRLSLIRVNPLLVRGLTISGLDKIVPVQSAAKD